uniref:Uncharacterized protein n=1 Tax=Entomoneis paludosa TaxID=265537 RepID=A0A7S2V9R9_9STRA
MALSIMNHFYFENHELQIPCMLLDSLLIYGLHSYESKLKKEQEDHEQKLAKQVAVQQETDKRDKKAQEAANRAQQKAQQRKLKNMTSKQANFGLPNNINQPDKAKKN